MPFADFGLNAALLSNLDKLKHTTPTPVQAQAIPAVLTGQDVVATAQTGTGKTAAFLLPTLHQLLGRPRGRISVLILTPTRELAQQIDQVFRGLAAGTGLRSTVVIGGVPAFPQERALRASPDVVVATPGRFLDLLDRNLFSVAGLTTLILDEADQMFDLGFFPALKRILAKLPARQQTLLFSATMPPEVAKLSQSILKTPLSVAVAPPGTVTQQVTQTVYPVPMHLKPYLLLHLLEEWEMPSVLVFTRTKHGARKLARFLAESGHGVAELHSDRSPAQRTRAMTLFRNRQTPILVATNIAARGIDVRHITHVVNFDAPDAPEEYVHRIGRTGRAGDEGDAILLVAPAEMHLIARVERQIRKKLPRAQATDFDYQAPPVKTPRPERTAAGFTKGRSPKKPHRGQGRR
jgi:ATP-dependent RNA helicase RhlE